MSEVLITTETPGARAIMRLGLLFLIALALAFLPVLGVAHHAAAHEAHASVDHGHPVDLEPGTQDHAVDSDCAAISGCPVCVVRHNDAGARVAHENPGSLFFLMGPEQGQSPVPDPQPPRPSLAA